MYSDTRYYNYFDSIKWSDQAISLFQNFDGYALYNSVIWNGPDFTTKYARGIFTLIPDRGYTGWLCTYTNTTTSFKCVSRFISLLDFDPNNAPDLTIA